MKRTAALRILFGADTKQFDRALKTSVRKLQKTASDLKSVGKSMSTYVSAPLAGIAAIGIKTATSFEFSMAKVKAVSGFAADEMQRLNAQAQNLGRTTSRSQDDVAGLQLELAKLGKSSTQIEQMTESILSLSIAFDTDLAQTATVVGQTLAQFGLDASESGRVANNMAVLFGSSALDLEKFDSAMSTVGPTASALGISVERAGAAVGILANAGVDASTIGTSLTKALTTMAKAGYDGEEALRLITTGQLDVATAFEFFGDRAGKIIPILQGTAGQYDELTKKQRENTSALVDARATLEGTTQGALDKLRSSLTAAAQVIGEKLLPAFTRFVERITEVVDWFSRLSDGAQGTILAIAGIAAGIGPLLVVIGTLVGGYAQLVIAKNSVALRSASLAAAQTAEATAIGVTTGAVNGATVATRIFSAALKAVPLMFAVAGILAFVDKMKRAKKEVEDFRNLKAEVRRMDYEIKDAFAELEGLSGEELRKRLEAGAFQSTQDYLSGTTPLLPKDIAEKLIPKSVVEQIQKRVAEITESGMETFGRTPLEVALNEYISKLPKAAEEADDLVSVLDELANQGDYTATEVDPLVKLAEDLAATKEKIAAEDWVQNDELSRLRALQSAFEDAAVKARLLGDMNLANRYRDQAASYRDSADALEAFNSRLERNIELQQQMGLAATTVGGLLSFLDAQMGQVTSTTGEAITEFDKFQQSLNQALTQALTNFTSSLATSIGELAAGVSTVKNLGAGLLTVFADLAIQLGELAIQYGFTISGIKAALKSLNAPVAIAAGAALVALGAGLKGAIANRAAEAGVPAFAEGGLVTGPTLALVGDNPSGREAIIPFEKMGQFLSMAGAGGQQEVVVTGRISGTDIYLSNQRTSRNRKR